MSYRRSCAILASLLILSGACKKKKDENLSPTETPEPAKPAVKLDFTAYANNRLLSNDTTWFSDAVGDSFTVTQFNYYITNIKLIRKDGSQFAEPESYRINRHMNGQTSFVIGNVPEGTYTGIEFLLGVDSLRNGTGAQTGALDIVQGMYWDWATGYVFFKLEGNFKSPGFSDPTQYAMHVGTNENLRKMSFDLGSQQISAASGKQPKIHFKVNVDEIFAHPTNLDMDTYHAVSGGKQAGTIAANYADMFSISSVEN